eukprot:jgi/Psemu1/8719/gm1.8719_g
MSMMCSLKRKIDKEEEEEGHDSRPVAKEPFHHLDIYKEYHGVRCLVEARCVLGVCISNLPKEKLHCYYTFKVGMTRSVIAADIKYTQGMSLERKRAR